MNRLAIGAVIVLYTLLSQFQFPGHTYLQQDSQIYVPILEHLWNPEVLKNDILVIRPHVSFTIFDETVIGLRKLTGLGFREVLLGEQMATRALGLWGIYLMAAAAGLALWPALLVTGIFALGAVIPGPSVLIWEYEPNPRGLAIPLLFLGVGLIAHRRYVWGGAAGALAFLIHPPTAYPFWAVYFAMTLWPAAPELMRRHIYGLAALLGAVVLLMMAARYQAGVGETQAFFTRLDPLREELQRMRASYVWVSLWFHRWWMHYAALLAATAVAWLRIRRNLRADLSFFLLGLPLVGVLSMPVSWLLLERWKWALMPQFQPLRALLFVTAGAIFTASVAGAHAAIARRRAEAVCWFAAAYLAVINVNVMAVPPVHRMAVAAGLAVAAALLLPRRQAALACALAAFWAVPVLGRVVNYPRLHLEELRGLSRWARSSTPVDAVFLFPDFGRDLDPGIFRSEALRAVYVDWKGGGQVNYLKELGEQWWTRWQQALGAPFRPELAGHYRSLGIDYIVVKPGSGIPGMGREFENAKYVVYRLR